MEFLVVGIGGFFGCIIRFIIMKVIPSTIIPLATLLPNIIAGFVVGVIFSIENDHTTLHPKLKLLITTGMMGGLTSFSTFSLETIKLFSSGKYGFAFLNVLVNISLGFLGVLIGIWLVKFISSQIA